MCWFRDQTFAFPRTANEHWKKHRNVTSMSKDNHKQASQEAFVASSNENEMQFY
jgi:hypothetical protein